MSNDEYPDLGLASYIAYGLQVGGLTFDGKPLPRWADLGDRGQTAWRAAAEAAVNVLRNEDAAQFPGVLLTSAPQVPSLGRIVLVPTEPTLNNGATEAPAVITRVWSQTTINARLMLDTGDVPETDLRTSLTYIEDLADAGTGRERLFRWTWPPRI
jgi:hypothetical protein